MLRVVVDTNLFVSALLSRSGAPARVIQAWKEHRFVLIASPAIISEIGEVLTGFIGRKPYRVASEDVDDILRLLQMDAVIVPGEADVSDAAIADPDDLIFLACAIEGAADIIASGDNHLRSLGNYHNIEIVSARQLLERVAT